jgi:hypothetical protein
VLLDETGWEDHSVVDSPSQVAVSTSLGIGREVGDGRGLTSAMHTRLPMKLKMRLTLRMSETQLRRMKPSDWCREFGWRQQ